MAFDIIMYNINEGKMSTQFTRYGMTAMDAAVESLVQDRPASLAALARAGHTEGMCDALSRHAALQLYSSAAAAPHIHATPYDMAKRQLFNYAADRNVAGVTQSLKILDTFPKPDDTPTAKLRKLDM